MMRPQNLKVLFTYYFLRSRGHPRGGKTIQSVDQVSIVRRNESLNGFKQKQNYVNCKRSKRVCYI